jgi:hypothetical protein
MTKCETCGNEYDKCMEIRLEGEIHTFDCFECAINMLAPPCHRCGCKIIGHGVESENEFYCCAHCANEMGVTTIRDRVDRVA